MRLTEPYFYLIFGFAAFFLEPGIDHQIQLLHLHRLLHRDWRLHPILDLELL
jgi:hypothetical protein